MPPKKKTAAGLSIFVLSALLVYVGYLLTIAGEFRTIRPHFNGNCSLVEGVSGPEDIALLADGSAAIISSLDRQKQLTNKEELGTIYYYDLTATNSVPINMLPNPPVNFHPHGIALFESERTELYVVNHPRGDIHGDLPGSGPAHTIEVFEVIGTSLHHLRSILDEDLLISPNDLAPVGNNQFYVTNDHGSGNKQARLVENYLRLARSHILFFDGKKFVRLPGTYGYANGIASSNDGSLIYMASPTDRTVYVFERIPNTNQLELVDEIFVDSGPDNINVDADGNLWVGAHPKLLTLAMHLQDSKRLSPSQVLRIRFDQNKKAFAEEILLSRGDDLPASTSAVHKGNRLLVGAIFSNGFLDCQMTQ